mgnify:CR=1 FL=1
MNFIKISKKFQSNNRSINVINDMSIEIPKGEIILINGSSGIGKSTLLNIIGCLLIPDDGFVKFEGEKINLREDNTEQFRINNFSYVFQDFNLLPEFNVYQNLLIPIYIKNLNNNESERKINNLLKYMNIEDLKFSYPNMLSQGEKQRVSFLRSLISNQDYIIADEPTGNLDEINTKIILELIVNINKDFKKTFVIASHDKEFSKIANKTFLIKNGNLIRQK